MDFGTGNRWWWQHEENGVVEKRFLEEYGTIARWNGVLGVPFICGPSVMPFLSLIIYSQEDRLWIADPKAIHHILQASGYLYSKPNFISERIAIIMDRGLVWATGELPFISHAV